MAATVSWSTIVSIIGLLFDIAGAFLLVKGLLMRDMTLFRYDRGRPEEERGEIPEGWYQYVPVWVALRIGSDDLRKTQSSNLDDYAANFWGLALLALGFFFQGIGQVIGVCK